MGAEGAEADTFVGISAIDASVDSPEEVTVVAPRSRGAAEAARLVCSTTEANAALLLANREASISYTLRSSNSCALPSFQFWTGR